MSGRIAHGGGITAAAHLYGGEAHDWLDLSTGINPNPVAIPPIEASAWHRLPDQHLVERARLAAQTYYRSGDCRPLPVPGTQSVIQLLPRLVVEDRRVAVLGPTYGEYRRVFSLAGLAVDEIADLDAVTEAHGLVVVVNPNNPDGRVHTPDQLVARQHRLCRQDAWLVVDEAFGDGSPQASLASLVSQMDKLIIFRSFGKFFGLAGIRLGFVLANPFLQERFEDWLGPWAVSGPALSLAATVFAGDTAVIGRHLAERSAALRSVLGGAGLSVAGGTDLFSLVVDSRAGAIHEHLCRHHILVRKFDYAAEWLRFGLTADAAEDRRLASALTGLTS
ncbi:MULTISPECIES: threonine-phosphate decarboxylase CobD [unclassified Rhizobium]|uniref:threonine-phosphate decarboxylase CobD n=1 Tax=unclassified Rhizobium TaxID=2613769 RepID=UPI001ADC2E02|nr:MULTISPECIES: threonine-phosphate decarboxylase CobD [unclassified Rhizobium]MBO9098750.1 threonine-phosphate decarboxylase [Rhizobium sp. L58/93]MBO9132445.1 threonine-phosphate decarboxylase [Rhizobium sp. B209b/85]MBO9169016.1 threonine-phosphate decarboxylase [Rhizobium sp. L245/93]MBO9184966.1 threonine-phosphate decarboxylase [Rhizobium sp. E27B/91]QXZ85127.1 threonine-phosphate decarboxylase [Rhizobium sp. K1/93]